MKKIVFALIAFSSLMVLSCRQQEDMLDSEDMNSLKVLQTVQRKTSLKTYSDTTTIKNILPQNVNAEYTVETLNSSIEGEGDKPPR